RMTFWAGSGGILVVLLGAHFFCKHCGQERTFLPIHFASLLANVTRQTLYRWMNREWLHWRTLPSGRRLICLQSLIEAHEVDTILLKRIVKNVAIHKPERPPKST